MRRAAEKLIAARGHWEIATLEFNSVKGCQQWVRRDGSFICEVGAESQIADLPDFPHPTDKPVPSDEILIAALSPKGKTEAMLSKEFCAPKDEIRQALRRLRGAKRVEWKGIQPARVAAIPIPLWYALAAK